MKLLHRCTGPCEDDPYECGVWINLFFGWLRLPLPLRGSDGVWRVNYCLGWWAPRNEAYWLLHMKEC